jgi:hypothetical protein
MGRPVDLDKIRTVIEEALSACVHGVHLPGIADAEVRKGAVSSEQLQQIAVRIEQYGQAEIALSAEVELFLRVGNADVLSAIEFIAFRVRVDTDHDDLRAVASNEEKDWRDAWERGIEPIKQAALHGIRRDIWKMDETLAEDSYTFQAAMVLLASELVGPYSDRIATFVGYPPSLVRVIAARLQEAKIWENDDVRCETWFDPKRGGMALLLDVMVADGTLLRAWSEEKKQYAYHSSDIRADSRFAV